MPDGCAVFMRARRPSNFREGRTLLLPVRALPVKSTGPRGRVATERDGTTGDRVPARTATLSGGWEGEGVEPGENIVVVEYNSVITEREANILIVLPLGVSRT